MVEGLEAVEEVANWIRKNGCNSHRSFWRRFRFSFRAYSFLQQLRLMRRKRCSRPSLKESTSGRCNYDLACYFSFLFPTSIFPLLPLSLPLCFPFSLLQRGKGMKGCSTKMGKCLFERDNETRDKTLSLLHPNSLSLSLSLERFFILVGERGGKIVWRSFSFYSRARFLSTSTIFGDEFLPRFRIFKKSSLDLDISNTYRPFKPHRRFNM